MPYARTWFVPRSGSGHTEVRIMIHRAIKYALWLAGAAAVAAVLIASGAAGEFGKSPARPAARQAAPGDGKAEPISSDSE